MPIRKISDLPESCKDADHFPPKRTSLPNGLYEHTCPTCKKATRLKVQRVQIDSDQLNQLKTAELDLNSVWDSFERAMAGLREAVSKAEYYFK